MAVPVTITLVNGAYGTDPTTPGNPSGASAFTFTNNLSTGVTIYFQVNGILSAAMPISVNLNANGGSYTTPTIESGSVNLAVVAQNGPNPYTHVIHVGSGRF